MKIGGTTSGLTAIQMDLKNPGIPVDLINDAVNLSRSEKVNMMHVEKTYLA